MAEVVGLHGVTPLENGADPSVIEDLESILEMAKRGEVVAFAAVLVRPNKEIGTRSRGDNCRHFLVAGCEYLKSDLIAVSERDD
jgi:hypothetical protein